MRNILLVARREYAEQIRGRAFRVTTVLLPAVFALIVGVGYLSSRVLGTNKHWAIATDNPVLANAVRDRLLEDKDAHSTVDVVSPASEETRAALLQKIQSKAIDGILSIQIPAGAAPTATYISQSSGDFITGGRLRSAVNHALVQQRLTAA